MNVSIFGLGYVGSVALGCLSAQGHNTFGIDVSKDKVELIKSGFGTVVEKDLDDMISIGVKEKRIYSDTASYNAVMFSEISLICVGTPNEKDGHLSMMYIYSVVEEIASHLKNKNGFHTIAIRSTVMPGINKEVTHIVEKISGKKNKIDFGIVSNPEFLREGTAVNDFFNPPYTIIASESEKAIEMMKKLYNDINGEIIVTDIGVAEMIKFINNSYHALKVTFGNEIGRICKKLNIDSIKLMEIFCKDTMLNISPNYFKPGFAYGGSCLPKDLKALNTISHDNYIDTPLLKSISQSNEIHINYALETIIKQNKKNIGFVSITFKPNTDDLRFSPALELAERLLGKGFNVNIYDSNINLSKLVGKNRDYLLNKIPHIGNILKDKFEDFVEENEVFVIANNDPKTRDLFELNLINKVIIELTKIPKEKEFQNIQGLCW